MNNPSSSTVEEEEEEAKAGLEARSSCQAQYTAGI